MDEVTFPEDLPESPKFAALIAAGVIIPPKSPRYPLPPLLANPFGGSPFTDEIIRERRGMLD
jgi:hypothetical protein